MQIEVTLQGHLICYRHERIDLNLRNLSNINQIDDKYHASPQTGQDPAGEDHGDVLSHGQE